MSPSNWKLFGLFFSFFTNFHRMNFWSLSKDAQSDERESERVRMRERERERERSSNDNFHSKRLFCLNWEAHRSSNSNNFEQNYRWNTSLNAKNSSNDRINAVEWTKPCWFVLSSFIQNRSTGTYPRKLLVDNATNMARWLCKFTLTEY